MKNNDEQTCEYNSWREKCDKPATYTMRYVDGNVCHFCKIHYHYYKNLLGSSEKEGK